MGSFAGLVRDFSEAELLASFTPFLPAGNNTLLGPGDDCAWVNAPGGSFVVTTDVLVSGQHFKDQWSSGFDVGRRAAAQNLADVVAMGAMPTAIVCSLVLPGSLARQWLVDFARGLAAECSPLGVGVVGGDLTLGPQTVVSVTAHGDLRGLPPLTRATASVGDIVVVTGTLGYSAAGWHLLATCGPEQYANLGQAAALIDIFRSPQPPYVAALQARDAGAKAAMDISDGLLLDAARMATASGVGIDFQIRSLDSFTQKLRQLLPASSESYPPVTEDKILSWVLTGGEDHAFLYAFPADAVLPAGFHAVGCVTATPPGQVTVDGLPWHAKPGWDHFRQ